MSQLQQAEHMIENAMILDYDMETPATIEEVIDEFYLDALNERTWSWVDYLEQKGQLREVFVELAHQIFSNHKPETRGIECHAILEGVIEEWAELAAKEEF